MQIYNISIFTWQIPKKSFDCGREGFRFPLNVVFQVELVRFPPVQAHGHQLGDLAGHPHHSVHPLVLQTAGLQGCDTVLQHDGFRLG